MDISSSETLTSIIDTVREPFVVLNRELYIVFANRSFYQTFAITPCETEKKHIYALQEHSWDIIELRQLLEDIIPYNSAIRDYRVEHNFPAVGKRIFLLNARQLYRPENHVDLLLLAMEDITERHQAVERLRLSITESNHRIKNTLNVIVGYLSLFTKREQLPTKKELEELMSSVRSYASLHDVISIQASQSEPGQELVQIKPLLDKMLQVIQLSVGDQKMMWQIDAVHLSPLQSSSLALIVNELVTNSLKYTSGKIDVALRRVNNSLLLTVEDQGSGFPFNFYPETKGNTGLRLVKKLAEIDLKAHLEFDNLPQGGARVSLWIPFNEESYLKAV